MLEVNGAGKLAEDFTSIKSQQHGGGTRGRRAILTVKDVMRKELASLRSDASIETAATLCLKQGLQYLCIVDGGGKPQGVVTTRSFLMAMVGGIDQNAPVREVMVKAFQTIAEQAPWEKLLDFAVEPVFVINAEGKISGLLTKADMQRIVAGTRTRFPINDGGKGGGAAEGSPNLCDVENIVHELQNAKALLQELEGIIEASYDGIVVTDSEGQLLRISRSYSRISGIPWEELKNKVGCYMGDLQARGEVSSSVSMLVLEKKKALTIKQRLYNGRELMVTGNPIFDQEGRIVRVVSNIRDISELNNLKREIEENKEVVARYCGELEELRARNLHLEGIIAQSPEMRRAADLAVRVASVDATVLITGETGVGKEVIAKIIHKASRRKNSPFITVNCGAIPETLLESELFGYEKGAFTGANREGKIGLLEVANNGTIFLDEIGDLPLLLQGKLLRALQEQEICRIGGSKSIKLNLRILSATNKDLVKMIKDKTFRDDLYYRLNVIPIHLPPLRERKEDIVPLAVHFLKKYTQKYQLEKKFSVEVLDVLEQYMWPGNVRELENLTERLLVTSDSEAIRSRDLPNYFGEQKERGSLPITVHNVLPLKEAGEILERELLTRVLSAGRSTRKAAGILGVDHSTIVRKINKYSLVTNNREK